MATILQVMDGIETGLKTIAGLRVTEYVPDQINPPQAFVGVPPVEDYNQAMARGKYELRPTITVLVSAALDRIGQRSLAELADLEGPKSIPAAIHADPTLGGAVESIQVESFNPLGMEEVGLIGYYGGIFNCRALVRTT